MVGCTMMDVLLLLLLLSTSTRGESEDQLEVTTKLGTVRGLVQSAGQNRSFYSFRGIPYAKPPVGTLRFKDPVSAEGWSGIRESFDPPPCPQITPPGTTEVVGEEDCLYLHVYTTTVDGSSMAVMVFIHGGAFLRGSPDTIGGTPVSLMSRDVVLVSIQYRLSTLGFISTEDEVLPGNFGVKDQTEALRWVHSNIGVFGGDPTRVTVFGQSAGAASVHLQIFSPSATGLFHRAIMQSGNALCPWVLRRDHRQRATIVGEMLGCPGIKDSDGNLDSLALLTCLQQAPVDKLILAQAPGEIWNEFPFYMVPRVDGVFLPEHPAQLLREGRYNKVDIISGVTANETAYIALNTVTSSEGERLMANFSSLGPIAALVDQEEGAMYLTRRIFYHYLDTKLLNISIHNAMDLLQMTSNIYHDVPHDLVGHFHSQDWMFGRKVYLYQLDHRASVSFTENYNTSLDNQLVAHSDDLLYLFDGVYNLPSLDHPADLMLREIILDLWVNFAATGNPTPELTLGFKWWPASPSCLHHLSLIPVATMMADTRGKIREFLSNLPTEQNKILFQKFSQEGTNNNNGQCYL